MSTTLAPPSSTSASSSAIAVLADDRDALGEGPVHDPRVGKLYRVDIEGKKVLSIDLRKATAALEAGGGGGGEGEGKGKGKEGATSSAPPPSPSVVVGATPEAVGCLCLTSDPDTLLIALSRSVYSLSVSTGRLSAEPLATLPESEGVEGLRFNDGKVSPGGVFVIGRLHSKWRDGFKGAVYALRKKKQRGESDPSDSSPSSSSSEWALERVLGSDEVGMGNGMAWRPRMEGKAEGEGEGEGGGGRGGDEGGEFDFLIVDSAAKTVQRFRTDPETGIPLTGTGRIALDASDFQNSVPDGMDVDSRGNLWVALAETGSVVAFDPKAKQKGLPISRVATLRLPLTRVTSCAFGCCEGDDRGDFSSTMFVVSREEASKLKEEASPVAGAVLIVSDVAGATRVANGGKVSAGRPVPALVEL